MSATRPLPAPATTVVDRLWRRASWLLCIASAVAATVVWLSWLRTASPPQATLATCLTLLAVASVDATLFSDRETRGRLGFSASRPAAALAAVGGVVQLLQLF